MASSKSGAGATKPQVIKVFDWEVALYHCLALVGDQDQQTIFELYAKSNDLSKYQLEQAHDLLLMGYLTLDDVFYCIENDIPSHLIWVISGFG